MIQLQDRDYNILYTIGKLEIMSYDQIQKMFFPTMGSCYVRVGELIKEKLVECIGYKNAKYFRLAKKGIQLVNSMLDTDYQQVDFALIEHREMRTELYIQLQKYDIDEWKNEVALKEIGCVFDVSFEYDGKLYLVEIHNQQKTKVLKEKIVKLTQVPPVFTLLIYAKNINPTRNMIDKLYEKGFGEVKKYQHRVMKFGKEIILDEKVSSSYDDIDYFL